MISSDQEFRTTMDRIAWFQNQVAELRRQEKNPRNYHASASGFLAEIDRMQRQRRGRAIVAEFAERHVGAVGREGELGERSREARAGLDERVERARRHVEARERPPQEADHLAHEAVSGVLP